jgi:hypothetical protein
MSYDLTRRDLRVLIAAEAENIAGLSASINQLMPNLDDLRHAAWKLNQLLDLLEASGKKAK